MWTNSQARIQNVLKHNDKELDRVFISKNWSFLDYRVQGGDKAANGWDEREGLKRNSFHSLQPLWPESNLWYFCFHLLFLFYGFVPQTFGEQRQGRGLHLHISYFLRIFNLKLYYKSTTSKGTYLSMSQCYLTHFKRMSLLTSLGFLMSPRFGKKVW